MIAPPYFQLDDRALLAHFTAAARACDPLPFYVYEFARASGYAVPPPVIERLREHVPNLVGMKVSDAPWDAFRPYLLEGLDVLVGPEALIAQGLEHGAVGAVSALASALPGESRGRGSASRRDPRGGRAVPPPRSVEADRARRGVPIREDVRRAAARADARRAPGTRRMARRRIVVAGAGAMGASIAYHLSLLGADDVVLCDIGEVASGATGKAMGGVASSSRPRRRCGSPRRRSRSSASSARRSSTRSATSSLPRPSRGWRGCSHERSYNEALGVPVEDVDPAEVRGLRADDVLGAVICREDGWRARRRPLASSSAARPGAEWRCASTRTRATSTATCSSSPAGRRRGELFDELPIRPLVRQLVDVGPVDGLPETLPMVVEEETTFHFRRRGRCLRLALREPGPRWSSDEVVDETLVADLRRRLSYRYPPAAGARVERAWAGLYDMTPDAHPIIGTVRDGVYVAAGFSGHGFMQSPALGRAVAEELLELEPTFDLTPYRLERFAGDEVFPEELVL